ncbi:putative oxidoreductase CipA-like protein [Thozetella sp. PMI_491]|nr:putative oxidoreductase CipA-like protein [Thozetella sp. PMI_491]
MTPQGRKIAIVGASGQVGAPMLKALLAQGVHTITAIQRLEATSIFPEGVNVKVGDLQDEDFLAGVLRGQDVLVLMPPLPQILSVQEPAIRAAAKVGVPYIFPSEFGPDPFATQLGEENILLRTKKQVRDLIEQLGVSSWVSVVVGPWLDVNLDTGLWGIDAKARKATLWSGAGAKTNTATVTYAGQATAAVLGLQDADLARYKNSAVYTSTFRLTQREILDAVQRTTGTTDADWDLTSRNVDDIAQEYEEKIQQGDEIAPYVKFFVTHFLEGHGGDFDYKVDAAEVKKLEELGLKKENLEEVIRAKLQ